MEKINRTDIDSLNRIDNLIEFLNNLDDETRVSAGDVLGYILGYFGNDSLPEDEIEIFNGELNIKE